MASSLSRVSAATVAFWVTTIISIASLGAVGAIAILLATTDMVSNSWIRNLTLAAGALDIVCLLGAVFAATLFLLRSARRCQLSSCSILALIALASALITIYSLAWLWSWNRNHNGEDQEHNTISALIQAGFAVWAISSTSQILMYAIIVWPYKRNDTDLPASELAARLQQVQSPKRSLSVRLMSLSSPRSSPLDRAMSDPTASHFSSPSLSPRSSFRRSVTHAIRPMTSKTRLLFRTSVASRDSPSLYSGCGASSDTARPQNEFRDWDTSGAVGQEEQPNDSFFSTRSTRPRLETIPGSRPVSPARPLDGPFKPSDAAEDYPLPDSPMASPALVQSEIGSVRTRPRAPSRAHSNHSQEAHIHPLFRSESPNPPPIASPGTIITASSYAGQVVNPEQSYFPPPRILRSAQGSRPASPSPLSPASSVARSRQGSTRSLRIQQTSPTEVRSSSALSWENGKEG